ncbi:MAG: LemA family protein [Clostridia bacterium]|nr:LemA family protein [Clostridia bacterium]
MNNPDRYVQYTDYGYDENGGRKRGPGVGGWIAIGILAVFLISIFSIVGTCKRTYNDMVDMEEDVNLAFANVQNVMQSRIEKIPDLVKVADEAAEHLETIYADISAGRASLSAASTPEELDAANAQMTENINQFLAVVENYPTITASQQYSALMDSIEGAANRILVAREDYNIAVSNYNRTVRHFPGNILANMFGFEEMEEFEADEAANNSSVVDFGD